MKDGNGHFIILVTEPAVIAAFHVAKLTAIGLLRGDTKITRLVKSAPR